MMDNYNDLNNVYKPDQAALERRRKARRLNSLQGNIALSLFSMIAYFDYRSNPSDNWTTRLLAKYKTAIPGIDAYTLWLIYALIFATVLSWLYYLLVPKASLLNSSFDINTELQQMHSPEQAPAQFGFKSTWDLWNGISQRSTDNYLKSSSYKVYEFFDWMKIIVLVICAIGLVSYYLRQPVQTAYLQALPIGQRDIDLNTNHLQLERLSYSPLSVPVISPIDLSKATRQQILNARINYMQKYAMGQGNSYHPFSQIFSNIEDNKPWWSWRGLVFEGPGENAVQGMSFRANSILNPLALIWPNFWEQSLRLTNYINLDAAKNSPNFPMQPKPLNIRIGPSQKLIDMRFQVSAYNTALSPFLTQDLQGQTFLNFEGVNARDMGYPYIYFDPVTSSGLSKINGQNPLTQSVEFYHVGSSCGASGGCNNLSPRQEGMVEYMITQLPALAEFKLWHNQPNNVTDPPDITYMIHFE